MDTYISYMVSVALGEFLLPLLFIFGVIVGSFLNVVIYRLHTNRSLNGSSHCLSCGVKLSWYELFPLFSYLLLKGACRHCGAHIPPRYFLVELATGIIFFVLGTFFGPTVTLLLLLIVSALIVVIFVYDVRHTIIPDEMVIALLVAAFILVSWNEAENAFQFPEMSALISALTASAFYGGLWYISKGRWIGLGDAKLAFPLGLMVGWPLVVSLIVWSFWIGAIMSVAILGLKRFMVRAGWGGKRLLRFQIPSLTMKSEIPFAPFLIFAFVLTALYQIDVFMVTERILTPFGL